MENLLTTQVKTAAKVRSIKMPLGTGTRLNVNGNNDICIQSSSSGVYFYHSPIGVPFPGKLIKFEYFKNL